MCQDARDIPMYRLKYQKYMQCKVFFSPNSLSHLITVNYWYDMEYDIKYNYYKFVERLANLKR